MLTEWRGVAGEWHAAAPLFAGMGETEVRGTAEVLVRSWHRGEEVGGVVVVGGGAGGRRSLAGVRPAEDGDGRARFPRRAA